VLVAVALVRRRLCCPNCSFRTGREERARDLARRQAVICYDAFHVAALAKGLDTVRRQVWQQMCRVDPVRSAMARVWTRSLGPPGRDRQTDRCPNAVTGYGREPAVYARRVAGDAMSRRTTVLPSLAALSVLVLTGCGDGGGGEAAGPSTTETSGPSVGASFVDESGGEHGTVEISFDGDRSVFVVDASGLQPGLHGFHVHKTGVCEPDSPDPADPAKTGAFLSAGGHLAEEGQTHGEHLGDLPSLLVAGDGSAQLTFTTDRLRRQDVLDEDGSAVMVHALPDNFGNIPDRYAPEGPDETTTKTGDAGARIACAAVTAGGG
jgi:superoxide dismutase, Cu-Zn family